MLVQCGMWIDRPTFGSKVLKTEEAASALNLLIQSRKERPFDKRQGNNDDVQGLTGSDKLFAQALQRQ